MVLIDGTFALALFEIWATHSLISSEFVKCLSCPLEKTLVSFLVSSPSGHIFTTTKIV